MTKIKKIDNDLVYYDGFWYKHDAPILWTGKNAEKYWVSAYEAVKMQQAILTQEKGKR